MFILFFDSLIKKFTGKKSLYKLLIETQSAHVFHMFLNFSLVFLMDMLHITKNVHLLYTNYSWRRSPEEAKPVLILPWGMNIIQAVPTGGRHAHFCRHTQA